MNYRNKHTSRHCRDWMCKGYKHSGNAGKDWHSPGPMKASDWRRYLMGTGLPFTTQGSRDMLRPQPED
jgi:hypothetical protein